jgi:hypothetical protein
MNAHVAILEWLDGVQGAYKLEDRDVEPASDLERTADYLSAHGTWQVTIWEYVVVAEDNTIAINRRDINRLMPFCKICSNDKFACGQSKWFHEQVPGAGW